MIFDEKNKIRERYNIFSKKRKEKEINKRVFCC